MSKRRLLWQLYPSYLLIVLVSLLAITWYTTRSLRQFYLQNLAAELESQALLAREQVAERLGPDGFALEEVRRLCRRIGRSTSVRLTVALPDGEVIADSEEAAAAVDNLATQSDFRQAVRGSSGHSQVQDSRSGLATMRVAVPLTRQGRLEAVVRVAMPLLDVEQALNIVYSRIAWGGVVIALLAALVCLVISRRIARPLEEMRRGAELFARGNLSTRLPVSNTLEIGGLAEAMNQMASQLADRIRDVNEQRNEYEAVLASMVEGVIAVDTEERVLNLNNAVSELLGVDPIRAKGRAIQEVVRNPDLQRLVSRALERAAPVQGDIAIHNNDRERILQAQCAILRDTAGKAMGAVIVLHDITKLRRLENIRRDFVANVSHELKTPITSIKGFLETLMNSLDKDPAESSRFLNIMLRQTDRLNAIIEDLLSLSRIEQESERPIAPLSDGSVRDVLQASILGCQRLAGEKEIVVKLGCDESLRANINAPLLEQAVTNLIDNAVKYSEANTEINVDAERLESGGVVISVRDEGCGIDAENLPRVFERFYRVDKARSRALGGTGLGLAIVKHVAIAHRGQVSCESARGKGSIFRIHLPPPFDPSIDARRIPA